jgi:hypothetical protein
MESPAFERENGSSGNLVYLTVVSRERRRGAKATADGELNLGCSKCHQDSITRLNL